MFTRGDFHIHSSASDGSLSPSQITVTAAMRGIDTIAIADHNTTDGILEAASLGRFSGVAVIPAVELSVRLGKESIHLLGYFRDTRFRDPDLRRILRFIKEHRAESARAFMGGALGSGSSGNHLSIEEGIALLKFFGAAVVLAHPIRIKKDTLDLILQMPLDGIEAKYCWNHSQDTLYFTNLALSRFPFYTAGSDFHTSKKKGGTHCLIGDPFLNQEEIHRFLSFSGAMVLY